MTALERLEAVIAEVVRISEERSIYIGGSTVRAWLAELRAAREELENEEHERNLE